MGNICGGPKKTEYKRSSSLLSNYRVNEFGEAKIIIVGLDNAGKTAIYKTILGESTENLQPTSGFNTKKIDYNDDIKIDLWEIGGAAKIRPQWKVIYKNVDGIIFVVDSADKSRFSEASKTLIDVVKAPQLAKLPVMVLAHKSDADGAASEEEVKNALKVNQIIDRTCWVQTSTINGMTTQVLESMLENILKEKESKRSQLTN